MNRAMNVRETEGNEKKRNKNGEKETRAILQDSKKPGKYLLHHSVAPAHATELAE